MKSISQLLISACLLFFLTIGIKAGAFPGDDPAWRPVSQEEQQMKTSQVEPDADAEAIFWDVRLDNKKADKLSYYHYVRVKIFTERGREKFSKFDIPFTKGKKVEDVAARVIKPDGTIINLSPADIFEREIIKAGKIKILAKSFAVPGIEPGVIVEYQYREIFKDDNAGGERLFFQRDIPMQKVTYHVRPFKEVTLKYNYYNMPETSFVEDPSEKGYYVASMTNVPAYKEEPYMPPDDEVRKWVYLRYQSIFMPSWNDLSRNYASILDHYKATKLVKQKTAEVTASARNETEKLRNIYDFTQKRIRNSVFDQSLSAEQADKSKIEDLDDVLQKGMGNSALIDLLFAAMAQSAGFEVRIALAGNRSENFFSRDKYPFLNFVHPACIAVKVGDTWRYFNPGTPFLPFESLLWYEEGVNAMLVGPEGGYVWTKTPLADHNRSAVKRTGNLKLLEDGTLEGKLKYEYYGHLAINQRRDDIKSSPAKREEDFKKEIKTRFSGAEVSNVVLENFDDNSAPLIYTFTIKVPGYAQKTGKRLFFQPGFFKYGSKPVFASAKRTYGIYFPYPWSEEDYTDIQLPSGFELDNGDVPAELHDAEKVSGLKIVIASDKAANKLIYHRKFFFGSGKNILFPVESYPVIKALFDGFHKADNHVITLKQKQ